MKKNRKLICGAEEYEKLSQAVAAFEQLPEGALQDVETVSHVIATAGLSYDPRLIYGSDNHSMNSSRFGAWQIPEQLARVLIFLGPHHISSLLEIGTFKGWTTTLCAAYLRRFSPALKTLTIDPVQQFTPYPVWEKLDIQYRAIKSTALVGVPFDVCLIDGDHSFQSVRDDYLNSGRFARFCLFHDINEELCPDVRRFWHSIEANGRVLRKLEFLSHSEERQVMGFGVVEHQTE